MNDIKKNWQICSKKTTKPTHTVAITITKKCGRTPVAGDEFCFGSDWLTVETSINAY